MKTKFHLYLSIFAIFAFLVIPKSTFAASTSPFIGHWQAIDVDGSDIRLSIAGPPQGPFQITWTESYISFCDREAGIVRGTGWLNEGDSNLLEADLHLECFTTGASLDFQIAWVYDPGTDTISDGSLTWHRPGQRGGKCLPPPAGLTGWWPGDGDANDIVSGRNGIFVGDATTRSGLVDLAFSLDGDGDFIDVPDSPGLNFGPGNFTVDLWVNFNDTSGEQVLAEKWVQGDEYVDGWTLTKLESGELRFALDSGEGNEVALDTEGLTLLPHIWYHFAATRQGSEITLYKNGGIVARNPEIGSSNLNSPSSLKFGHRGNSEDTPGSIDDRGLYLKGRIDEVELLVGTALSENQILAIYQAGSDGKCKDEVQPPPPLDLRVNYGDDDWVESFYEAGHTVWITVTEDDGATVRATAKLVTQPRDEWGGEEGFQTSPEDWVPSQPEIQPNDWVFGWVDNGASAQVQIGDISGIINLMADSVEGTIYAPWFSDEVEVECHSWGAPFPEEILKYDMALPNGEDTYACSWAGEWNILPGQVVGVGYLGPDGHWVANTFSAFTPQIIASESEDWFWTTGFIPGSLNLFIFESADEDAALLWQGTRDADEGGFASVGYEDHGQDLVPGNVLVISDEMNQKELVLEPIAVDVFDAENEIMAGTAPPGSEVWAAAGPMEWQERIFVEADPESGEWLADFKTIGFDITEEMRASSYAHIYDGDGDANEGSIPPPSPNPHFYVFPEWDYIIGWEWPAGTLVTAEVYHPDGDETPDCVATAEMTHPEWSDEEYVAEFFLSETCDIQAGDFVLLTDGLMGREHIVFPLQVTTLDPDMDTIGGVAEPGIEVNAWVHGEDSTFQTVLPNKHGNWMINFSPFNLEPGMGGRAEQYDEDGDATSVDWWIPNPRFTVFP
ncbi:MAG: LamG domain-containing protein, partial [Anaerolineales bacterium]